MLQRTAHQPSASHLYDPRGGDEAFCVQRLSVEDGPWEPPRTNFFTVLRIESGEGRFWADAGCHPFQSDCLLFFVPYQHIRLEPAAPVRGWSLQFHANFLCVETFHAEVGCSGVLFNDPYSIPAVELEAASREEIDRLIRGVEREAAERNLASDEVILSHLKVLLILATRLKLRRAAGDAGAAADLRDPVLQELRELIERHYCTLHAPADYARLLHMTPKALGRRVRARLGKTLTDLIRERILTHAKWQLLHTLKPVKEIAREVGFADELYFSRLFKKATGLSPTFFREFETEIRGGSNLSMFSSPAPIQPPE